MTNATETEPTDRNAPDAVLARAFRFTRRDLAFANADRSGKGRAVLLGDDGRYWVVTLADAARLERWGYEFAR